MEEVYEIIYETGELYLQDVINSCDLIEDPITGSFPVVTPYEDKFYQGMCVCTILADEFILYIREVFEISVDDYLDFRNEINNEQSSSELSLN